LSSLIITVDGPGGTGKSSVTREVARRLGLPYLDTGAFYRAATLASMRAGADAGEPEAVARVVAGSAFDQEDGQMFLDGEDVSEEIRGQDVEGLVSQVAANSEVRKLLVAHQRAWAKRHQHRAVIEGRDIGSVVFPEAEVKVYLDASPEVRARRRAIQSGTDAEAVHSDLQRRDHIDSSRETSPLQVPEGAVIVDTSDLGFEAVVDRVVSLVEARSS
jgi:CMP/dCMP kinase